MNRHDRRKRISLLRKGKRALKLRCAGCERAGRRMTNEHFFPRWLIEYANAFHEGIQWIEPEKRISAEKATVPLCDECNNAFGTTLEGPVSKIFRSIEAHRPLSDADAELLVRWMWKFEGLQWYLLAAADSPHAVYSERYTLRERVTASYA